MTEYCVPIRPLNYTECNKMFIDLVNHVKEMNIKGYTYIGFDDDDVVIDNEGKYTIINKTHLKFINSSNKNPSNKYINFYEPFVKPIYTAPEINKINELPSHCLATPSIQYALAQLILAYCQSMEGTKMGWCLKRMMHQDPALRVALLI